MQKLFMLLIGATPPGRNIEQHDIFFGIGASVKELLPSIIKFWPEAASKIHVDAWREVTYVDGYKVQVKRVAQKTASPVGRLFFINLGGYRRGEFEEFHYKTIVAAKDKAEAIQLSKQTAFYKHTGFAGANSHIDDKYGIDVDDLYEIKDILGNNAGNDYCIELEKHEASGEDEIHLGYFKFSSFE